MHLDLPDPSETQVIRPGHRQNLVYLGIKAGLQLYLVLLCLGLNAQSIELLPIPEDSTTRYKYYGRAIVYKNKLYMRYLNNSNTGVMVAYDGQDFTVYPPPPGYRDYQGYPIIYQDKIHLIYRDDQQAGHLAAFDGTGLKLFDLPDGYSFFNGDPHFFIHHDKLYMACRNTTGPTTLMVFDGQDIQPVAMPSEYQGVNRGYSPVPQVLRDTAVLLLRKAGYRRDLGYLVNGELHIITSPPGYDDEDRGFDGSICKFAGKVYLRYKNNAGGFDLAIWEKDSLRFQTIPESLGGSNGLQSLYQAVGKIVLLG